MRVLGTEVYDPRELDDAALTAGLDLTGTHFLDLDALQCLVRALRAGRAVSLRLAPGSQPYVRLTTVFPGYLVRTDEHDPCAHVLRRSDDTGETHARTNLAHGG